MAGKQSYTTAHAHIFRVDYSIFVSVIYCKSTVNTRYSAGLQCEVNENKTTTWYI